MIAHVFNDLSFVIYCKLLRSFDGKNFHGAKDTEQQQAMEVCFELISKGKEQQKCVGVQ